MYKVDCVILAAGRSTRMKMDLSKPFLEINCRPVIYYSINRFVNHDYINKVILVLNSEYVGYFNENVAHRFFQNKQITVVIGGHRRQDSLRNALKFVESDYVMVHDGARPFLSEECITNGVKFAYIYGASSCYVVPKDTIKIDDCDNFRTLDRKKLICIQTPQCFRRDILLSSYDYVFRNNKEVTDETSALDLIGEKTFFYLGEYSNIKITTKEDLYFGSVILNNILGEMS